MDQLSPERLVVAWDCLSYLVNRDFDEATAELLAMPGLTTALKIAEQEADASELTDWRNLQDDA